MPGISEVPKNAKVLRSQMDTVELTPGGIRRWKKPPFQRELRITPKVLALRDEILSNGGILPGVITLGKMGSDTYLVDGQHRTEAFLLTEMPVGYVDARICFFEDMGEMGEEFVKLNSALVRMKNDDIVRGLEGVNPLISAIRKKCPFVGYDRIRQGNNSRTLLAMAVILKTWFGSAGATPTPGPSSIDAIKLLDDEQVKLLTSFLADCNSAWGNDQSNYRLWGTLNMSILMWLWRRIAKPRTKIEMTQRGLERMTYLEGEQWAKCLMALSADVTYSAWLVGRAIRDRDRSPCYSRIRSIMTKRLTLEGVKLIRFPQAEWTKS
jgi:hypothetical protein